MTYEICHLYCTLYLLLLQSQVLYIDFGNGETVDNTCLVEIPGNLSSIKPQAERYRLLGLQAASEDPDSMGYAQVS